MRVIGLTGGIASGKTTVSNLFKISGVPVIYADLVARQVVEKGTVGLSALVQIYVKTYRWFYKRIHYSLEPFVRTSYGEIQMRQKKR